MTSPAGSDFQAMSARQKVETMKLVQRSPFDTSLTLQQMGIPPSTYYNWLQQQVISGTEESEEWATEIVFPMASTACPTTSFCESCRPSWVLTQEALLLTRSVANAQDLLFAPTPILNVTDLPFNFEAGPRISAIHRLDRGCGLEINYFGIDAWSSSAVRDGNAGSPLVIFPPGGLVSTQFTVAYSSELYSAEGNVRYGWRENLDLLAGFRYAELQEDFSVVGAVVPPQTAIPSYVTHSRNHLYGFQIGAVARLLNRHSFLSL
ncbi:MAG: hypothetical protein HQ581_08355, partial [Planctomycetes bacterium]|nr:hypothetical protein [Planctomycetota bacterium]